MTSPQAPVVQMMLTVQFAPPVISLDPVSLTDTFNAFRSDFPVFEQVQRAGPMPANVDHPEIHLSAGAPRNSFRKEDHTQTLLFQEDRFSYSWQRPNGLVSSVEYPGYDVLLGEALGLWERLRSVIPHFATMDIAPIVCELLYTDHFPLTADKAYDEMASIFRFLAPGFTSKPKRISFSYMEPIDELGFCEMAVNGPGNYGGIVDAPAFAQLQTTGRMAIMDGWDGVKPAFDRMHDVITEGFTRLINPDFRPI